MSISKINRVCLAFATLVVPSRPLFSNGRILRNRVATRDTRDGISRMTISRCNVPISASSPKYALLVADEERGGPVLHGLRHHQELLRRAGGLYKNQGLHRRGGRDCAGRPVYFRDASARRGQIRRCRPIRRREDGNRIAEHVPK